MVETVMLTIIAAAPALTAVISIIAAVIKLVRSGKITNKNVISKIDELEQKVLDTKEYQSLKQELLIAHQENRTLRQKLNELLTKVDKISRGEEDVETE